MGQADNLEPNVSFKNRKGLLIFFGIIEFLFGIFSILMLLFSLLGILMIKSNPELNQNTFKLDSLRIVLSSSMYFLIGALFIALGIGNIRIKRWARALSLILSWYWLIGGSVSFLFMLLVVPKSLENIPNVDSSIMQTVSYLILGGTTLFFVILPLVFILFFQSKNVKLTVESYDNKIIWTDRLPLPIIGFSVILAFGALVSLLSVKYASMPFFGIILKGLPGAFLVILNSALVLVLAYFFLKLDVRTWWGLLIINIFWMTNSLITYSNMSLLEFYQKTNMPTESVEILKQSGLTNFFLSPMVLSLFTTLITIGFLIYIKKYFKNPQLELTIDQTPQNSNPH